MRGKGRIIILAKTGDPSRWYLHKDLNEENDESIKYLGMREQQKASQGPEAEECGSRNKRAGVRRVE